MSSDYEEEVDMDGEQRNGEEEKTSLIRETVSSINNLSQSTTSCGAGDADARRACSLQWCTSSAARRRCMM